MVKHLLITAWRDLVRSPVQSLIAIGGLAIGLMAAIIAGVVTVDAFTRDHFIPGNRQLYFAVMEEYGPSVGEHYQTQTPYNLASYIRDLPGVSAIARIAVKSQVVRRGEIRSRDAVSWVDPVFFRIYSPRALHGDLAHALDRPDGMVLTLAAARRYFGRDNVVGETLALNRAPFVVSAVIADWPLNQGQFSTDLFASSQSPASTMSLDKGTSGVSRNGDLTSDMTTMVQLAPGASRTVLDRAAAPVLAGFVPSGRGYRRSLHFERLDEINMSERLNPDNRAHLIVMETVTLVVLALSILNFINLSFARSTHRALEVAVRKVAGAGRRALIVQFLGESVLQALGALAIAIVLVEWSLPAVNNFLESGAVFDYWGNPLLMLAMLWGTVLVGVLAGAWPALVLSSFRPVAVLKGWFRGAVRNNVLRQGFVALQFASLIVFLIAAGTAFEQNDYATRGALRVDVRNILMISVPKCDESLRIHLSTLPGVESSGCSVGPGFVSVSQVIARDGHLLPIQLAPVGYGFLEMFGLKPIAGRLFSPALADDVPNTSPRPLLHYVVNEAAVGELGFPDAASAIGHSLRFPSSPGSAGKPVSPSLMNGTIVGVVRDFSLNPEFAARFAGSRRMLAAAYAINLNRPGLPIPASTLFVKLDGGNIQETLMAIDAAWKHGGYDDPINRNFLDAFVQRIHQTVQREGQAFAAFAGIATVLACLGLFGVSLLATRRRIKEIGVRKAMGASDGDILFLLLWQFARPVLWACLIAWPVAFLTMRSWLDSFIFRTDLDWRLFPAAGVAALTIAFVTVAGQAWLVARQKPVLALRYE